MAQNKTELYKAYIRKFYQRDILAYISRRLRRQLTRKQTEIVKALIQHKKVIVTASHSVGKSFIAACVVWWFFECFKDSVVITTAPTARQVRDILWKEIRRHAPTLTYLQPVAPRMQVSAEWFAVGMTASKGDAFQGLHAKHILLVADEATGVNADIFEAGESMLTGDGAFFLAICNPTDPASKIKQMCDSGDYHVINASALDHENVIAQLRGEPMPIRGAVDLAWLERAFKNWSTKIPATEANKLDVEWPPGSGQWFRPGPIFEGRVLGRWPTQTTDNIWSEGHWNSMLEPQHLELENLDPERGPVVKELRVACDVARFGDDYTTIWIRRGPCVLKHETFNGNAITTTVGFILDMIREFILPHEAETGIPIFVDDAGVGGGVVDMLAEGGYNVVPVNAGNVAFEKDKYGIRRNELWFEARETAVDGSIDISRISDDAKKLLRHQLLSVKYKMNSRGQRIVEPKDELKKAKRLTRSPDDADAFNLLWTTETSPIEMRDLDSWT